MYMIVHIYLVDMLKYQPVKSIRPFHPHIFKRLNTSKANKMASFIPNHPNQTMLVSNETTQGNTTHYDIDDHVAVDLNKINLYEMNSSYYNSNTTTTTNNNNNEKDIMAQGKLIKDRLITNGFVKLENFLDKETVNNARLTLLQYLKEKNMVQNQHGILLTGYKDLCEANAFKKLFCNEKIHNLFANSIFNNNNNHNSNKEGKEKTMVQNIGEKGIRVIGKNEQTSLHTDGYRYNILSPHIMYNVWIPLNDIDTIKHAPLILCNKSHLLTTINNNKYNDGGGDDKNSVEEKWYTSSKLNMGDIIIFDGLMIHGSCINVTDQYRLSCDYRYISKSYYDSKIRNDM